MSHWYPENDLQLQDPETLTCKPLTVEIDDNYRHREKQEIHLWAKDQNSQTYLCRITSFPVHLVLEVPSKCSDDQDIYWDQEEADKVHRYFSWFCQEKKVLPPYHVHVERRYDIYYYHPFKKTYLVFYFHSESSRKVILGFLRKSRKVPRLGEILMIPQETNINSFRRMMTERKCQYSQWFTIEGLLVPKEYEDRASVSTVQEYFVNWETLIPSTSSWFTYPTIAVWDIETYSDNHRSMPSSFNLKHTIYLISIVFSQLNHPETTRRVCLMIDPEEKVVHPDVISLKNEKELLLKFIHCIREMDPDLISGYNIFGYDYDYLIDRFKIYNLEIPASGRLLTSNSKIYHKSWASSAYGKNIQTFLEMEGRIQIDLLPNVKRLFKMRNYTLDFVSKSLLGKGKHPISAKMMFIAYENFFLKKSMNSVEEMTKVVSYCIEDSNLVLEIFEKINLWYHLTELSSVAGVPILQLFTSGEQIRCYSNIYNMSHNRGYILSQPRQFHYYYSGAHVVDPSIIQAYNLCYTTLIPDELLSTFDKEDIWRLEFTQEEPISDKKDEKKKVTKSYSFSFVKSHIRKGILPELEKDLVDERNKIRQELKKINKQLQETPNAELELQSIILDRRQNAIKVLANSVYGFTGADTNGYLPILPVAMTITAMGRQLIKEAIDALLLKYSSYSAQLVYGDTDSCMISLSLNGTEDVAALGQEMSDFISGVPEKILPDGTVIPKVLGIFPPPLKMEFEDYCRILNLRKKMYIKVKRDLITKEFRKTVDGKYDLTVKGILLARKGKNKFSMTVYHDASERIMRLDNIVNTLTSLKEMMVSLLKGEYDIREKLTLVQELGSDYAEESYYMNIFANNLAKSGNIIKPGDRIEYIVVRLPQEDINYKASPSERIKIYLGNKLREITLWEQDPSHEEVDYLYYMEKGLMDPYDFLFHVGYKKICEDSRLSHFGYTPMFSRCHFVHFSKPIKMIMSLMIDFCKASDKELSFHNQDFSLPRLVRIGKILENFLGRICQGILNIFPEMIEEI
jgi:DNA polymerase delta subunit 1